MENNLSLYRIFYATALEGNISSAAKNLYISQPAVSKAISKLEASIGSPLFIRSSKGVTLTQEGSLLFSHVKTAFESLNDGEEQLKNLLETGGGRIRFGASTTLCKYVLLPYLQGYMPHHPNVRISIECQNTYETLKLLHDKKIDIGLIGMVGENEIESMNMAYRQVTEIEDIFVATKDYIRSKGTHDIIAQSTLLLLNKENITRQYIDHYFFENRVKINHVIEATSLDLLIEFAKIGLGLGCVIKEFVLKELASKQLIQIPLKNPIPKRSIGFVYPNGTMPSTASAGFVDYINHNQLF
ncbi:MAG: LysR family transcriptional regulator [Lachnospiraceae bacterium]|nr:LysR family transcriptional regulator [Lachnospiraceae bacterium]MCR4685110.1 LysR family transcriptional regulator [Lachnospiraceae bacterium]